MYTTQMDAARQGIITPQMKIVAEKERMDAEEIRSLVAKGQVIIPCNKNHKALHPSGVGARLTTKINTLEGQGAPDTAQRGILLGVNEGGTTQSAASFGARRSAFFYSFRLPSAATSL